MISRQADGLHCVVAARTGACHACGVLKARRRPCVGGMTTLTGRSTGYMCGWPAARVHSVMTARASVPHLGVVDRADRQPGQRGVTRLAAVARGDVIGLFSGRAPLVVAGNTTASGNRLMIDES